MSEPRAASRKPRKLAIMANLQRTTTALGMPTAPGPPAPEPEPEPVPAPRLYHRAPPLAQGRHMLVEELARAPLRRRAPPWAWPLACAFAAALCFIGGVVMAALSCERTRACPTPAR